MVTGMPAGVMMKLRGLASAALGDGKPWVGDVPGGQFALDGGQAAGVKGRQHLPACGAVGPWQFGLA
jgi:hypothetical protein